jgi:predicted phosphodiesterase
MKPVYKYSIDGDFIEDFPSREAAASNEGVTESSIRKALKKGTKCNGYFWKNIHFEKTDIIMNNVLVIGDLHEPFCKEGYIDFCWNIYNKYKCTNVVFIGDIIDSHYSSFHDTDPDGHSAAQELKMAKANIAKWHTLFPHAKVCLGNHDLLGGQRQAFKAGLSQSWIKPIGEVLETPTWEYAEEYIIDGVLYCHGTGRKANGRMMKDGISVVQGHYHSESYIMYKQGYEDRLFALQVGCGADDKSYAMAYGKHFDKMHINCGVVLENGKLPILEYMKL